MNHPGIKNPKDWLFVSEGKTSYGKKITRDGLLKHFQEYYRDKYFPTIITSVNVPDSDKAYIRSLLTKPINLYIFRHISLTEKSVILNEHMLRNHAGWSNRSKMPQVYIHHLGGASSKQILQSFGIIDREKSKEFSEKRIIICPNCNEPNHQESRLCIKCTMVLTYDSYSQTIEEQKKKEQEIQKLKREQEIILRSVQEMENKFQQIFEKINVNNLTKL